MAWIFKTRRSRSTSPPDVEPNPGAVDVEQTPMAEPDVGRAVRVAVRLGVAMLASGAQSDEAETTMRAILHSAGLTDATATISYATVSVSHIDPRTAATTTAVQTVRAWRPDFNQLAAGAALVESIKEGATRLGDADAQLDEIVLQAPPYPRWLRFLAPALLSFAVTIMFGGTLGDALTTLAIGVAIQPALDMIDRSELPAFFQVVFGVAATVLTVVLLVKAGLAIDGSLVLTGSLLRFLPGAALVSGMRDLIAAAYLSGLARLAEVFLIGTAIAGSASLMLALGERLDVRIELAAAGRHDWPAAVIVIAGASAVACYACRLGVPRRRLVTVAALGALAVLIAQGFAPTSADVRPIVRTLMASLSIGVIGTLLSRRSALPAAIWLVPSILPMLPAPATLLPLLAETEAVQQALQGQALRSAFAIGVGVASGSVVVATYMRYGRPTLEPVADAVSEGLATLGSIKRKRGQIKRSPQDR
jgi:uncharacterized membrane protein YjjP (DUF1212 family)